VRFDADILLVHQGIWGWNNAEGSGVFFGGRRGCLYLGFRRILWIGVGIVKRRERRGTYESLEYPSSSQLSSTWLNCSNHLSFQHPLLRVSFPFIGGSHPSQAPLRIPSLINRSAAEYPDVSRSSWSENAWMRGWRNLIWVW
jgi:hypothetical protein